MEPSVKQHEETGLTVCEFNGVCDVCEDPAGLTFAIGYLNEHEEVDSYICSKCANKGYEERKKLLDEGALL